MEIDRLIQLLARLLVKAVQGIFDTMDRAPIGHDPAPIAPVALEHLVEQEITATAIRPIDQIVGTHDRTRLAALYGDLKGQKVALAQACFRNLGVQKLATGLQIIEREMLDR